MNSKENTTQKPKERRSSLVITFELPSGEMLEGQITEITKKWARCDIKKQPAAALLHGGMVCQNCRLFQSDKADPVLIHFTVYDVKPSADLNFQVRFTASDEGSEALLWQIKTMARDIFSQTKLTRQKLAASEIERIPGRGIYTEEARLERLEFIRHFSKASLTSLQHTTLKADELTGNIENMFCGIEIPVGLVGPLLIHGRHIKETVFAPFATTEGALVASAARGATALTRAGGVTTRILSQRMMRVPLFVLDAMDGAFLFTTWIRDHFTEISNTISQVSRHARLIALDTTQMGNMVHVYFTYETGDAAGQNMTTACTWHACQWIMGQMKHFDAIKFENFVIDGNMSGDKKVNFQSFILGRGTRVTAECFIDRQTMLEVLKITPEQFCRIHHTNLVGGIQIGTVGYNVNLANVIAAIFTATGQDIACVHECSIGQFHAELVTDGVYVSLLLPSLIIGTVGGGTHLASQQELLRMMDCAGTGKVSRLAEIIAGFCLSLEISTGAAIASGQFANAHERLGRSRPVEFFTVKEINVAFFQKVTANYLAGSNLQVLRSESIAHKFKGSSIITEMTSRKVKKLLGLFPYRLRLAGSPDHIENLDVMLKIKPLDEEVSLMSNSLAVQCGGRLSSTYDRFKFQTGSAMCHIRELELYQESDPRFTQHMPAIYGIHRDDKREAYILVMEFLKNMLLMDSVNKPAEWTLDLLKIALKGAADFHAVYYGKTAQLTQKPWIGTIPTVALMVDMIPLWEDLSNHMFEEFAAWFDKDDRTTHRMLIATVPEWWAELEAMPRTLIHNDFNPRNLCFRPTADGPQLVAYDWELATLGVPQHDLAELMCFTLTDQVDINLVDTLIEHHRAALERQVGEPIDPALWHRGYRLSLWDLAINRFALYMMGHTFRHYSFMQRTAATLRHLMRLERGREHSGT